ncbi:ATP-binding cassette domain-containing protein [Muricauda sp. 2012CJ35-5]|uniref:ATP-binding cassette domain-containing protein n=1 Tax=Flagellimonas spongiicola TaxID=2942208 RepID=A0ABT0PTA1_9FLAO|nr:ATP-binding cassette domain-containing protein [Allomuricauda spongiicola]MCL6274622.1 ATP-binding cassette domain-containing protein [Allomuricauda spongiicola]
MITTSDLRYSYSNATEFEFPDISLKLGEHLLILGPSGIGKTTLLHLLSGLLPTTHGSISIAGTELNGLGRKALDRFRGASMGLIFQRYHFITSLTVMENLKLRLGFTKKNIGSTRIQELANRLGLAEYLNKKVTQLSQGQQQRLSIALGLIHKPDVIFADEPTSNLDDENCDKVIQLLKDEADLSGSSLIIITHDHRVKSHFQNQLSL